MQAHPLVHPTALAAASLIAMSTGAVAQESAAKSTLPTVTATGIPDDYRSLNTSTASAWAQSASATLPTVEVPAAEFEAGIGALALFVRAGLVASNGEARRQIKGGGLRVNDVALEDEKALVGPAALTPEGVVKLSLGRKKHILVRPS